MRCDAMETDRSHDEDRGNWCDCDVCRREEEEDKEWEDEDDYEPVVLIGTAADLADPSVPGRLSDRPVWFHLHEFLEKSTVFERLPEPPFPEADSQLLMEAAKRYGSNNSDKLQMLLGTCERLSVGVHVSASLDDVVGVLTDDGFDVCTRLAEFAEVGVSEH